MKQTRQCPKCGSTDLVRVPGGTMNRAAASQNYINTGFHITPVDRYVCCACGFSEEWVPEQHLKFVKEFWAETAL